MSIDSSRERTYSIPDDIEVTVGYVMEDGGAVFDYARIGDEYLNHTTLRIETIVRGKPVLMPLSEYFQRLLNEDAADISEANYAGRQETQRELRK